MFLSKTLLSTLTVCGLATASLSANELFGVVNFTTCVTDSKYGQKEQENFEGIRKQLSSMIEDTEKEIKEIADRFGDTDYLDSLSPKAEEELKARYQNLNEDLSRYQGQFYQIMQQANMQLLQKISTQIAAASERVATEKKIDYVINREACFYYNPNLDLTEQVISEMDKSYEIESKTENLADTSKDLPLDATDENALYNAG
jgi:outer membrane protein